MKKLFIIPLIFFNLLSFGQQTENRFTQSENEINQSLNDNSTLVGTEVTTQSTQSNGNPSDPVPIDQNLPLLILIAGVIIIAVAYKRKILPDNSSSQ